MQNPAKLETLIENALHVFLNDTFETPTQRKERHTIFLFTTISSELLLSLDLPLKMGAPQKDFVTNKVVRVYAIFMEFRRRVIISILERR